MGLGTVVRAAVGLQTSTKGKTSNPEAVTGTGVGEMSRRPLLTLSLPTKQPHNSTSPSQAYSYGATTNVGASSARSSPERNRRDSLLRRVPEEDVSVETDVPLEAEEDEWDLEERGFYIGSYRRKVALYTFVPLSSLLVFTSLAVLPLIVWPNEHRGPPSNARSFPSPLPELILSVSLWCLSYLLRLPLFTLASSTISSPVWQTILFNVVNAPLSQLLRLSALPVLRIRHEMQYPLPTWRDPVFQRVWWIALGWALADVTVGIMQGYEQLALYKEVMVPEEGVRDTLLRWGNDSRSSSDRNNRVSVDEILQMSPRPDIMDGGNVLRKTQSWISNPEDAIKLAVDKDLEQLMRLKEREELEEIYGLAPIHIPVLISMAALYLHQALFAPEPSVPPLLAHTSGTSSRASSPYTRHLSSVSTVTLRTASHSDHTYPSEPFLHTLGVESPAYFDLLARQPNHPSVPSTPSNIALSLEGDPLTEGEKRCQWICRIEKRLRRLQWAKRLLLSTIGGWAVYNTVRYYLAASLYSYRERQIILLVLGTSAALSLTLIFTALIIALFAPQLGWVHRPGAPHVLVQACLSFCASALLLGPAIINLVFVFLWRHSSNTDNTLQGRCHWDVDVFWSGLGVRCERSPAWGSWVAGAVVRLVLTFAFLVAYHLISYSYDVTRRPSKRKRRLGHRSRRMSHSEATSTRSSRSYRAVMMSPPTSPLPVAQIGRQPSITTSESHTTVESLGSSIEHRPLRSSRSRISSHKFFASGPQDVFKLPSAVASAKDEKAASSSTGQPLATVDASPDSSEEDLPVAPEFNPYGQEVGWIPGAYTALSSPLSPLSPPDYGPFVPIADEDTNRPSLSDDDLSSFVERFRSLVNHVSHETDEGITLDNPVYYPSPFAHSHRADHDNEYVPVLGKTIHRMPTIESLGSREVMSLATSSIHRTSPGPHHMSRPSTRSNNLSLNDGEVGGSTSSTRSRSNSLDAALALTAPPESVREGDDYEEGKDYSGRSSSPSSHSSSFVLGRVM
ncbi:uncharacterized protein FIBRA_02742 [Fibroporia radiculosa]|uniref:Uncharacterized protein n=1 Tax=Fibroporia radiculosa TaxID=599839 RepID=J4HVE9_9APHY|nr:uncharacterized protein FIBRA_02742 [Fibroporia radiculosa]CCM00702.1 predicted protein [Fibroporia radiculosa]